MCVCVCVTQYLMMSWRASTPRWRHSTALTSPTRYSATFGCDLLTLTWHSSAADLTYLPGCSSCNMTDTRAAAKINIDERNKPTTEQHPQQLNTWQGLLHITQKWIQQSTTLPWYMACNNLTKLSYSFFGSLSIIVNLREIDGTGRARVWVDERFWWGGEWAQLPLPLHSNFHSLSQSVECNSAECKF